MAVESGGAKLLKAIVYDPVGPQHVLFELVLVENHVGSDDVHVNHLLSNQFPFGPSLLLIVGLGIYIVVVCAPKACVNAA